MSVRRRQVGLHFRYTVAFLSDVAINLSYVRTVYTVCTVQDLCNHVSLQLNPTHSIPLSVATAPAASTAASSATSSGTGATTSTGRRLQLPWLGSHLRRQLPLSR